MTTFPPLSEVRNTLKIPWYRTRIEPDVLRELTKRSNLRGFAQAFGHLLLYLATGTLIFWLWHSRIWVGFAFALLLHGAFATHLKGTAPHELGHGTVFRSQWLNVLFLNVFSIVSWWDYVDFDPSHRHHHMFTLHLTGDREIVLPQDPLPGAVAMIQLCTFNFYTPGILTFVSGGLVGTVMHYVRRALHPRPQPDDEGRNWLNALHQDNPQTARRSAWLARATLLFHAVVVVVGIATGLWVLPVIITLGSFFANISGYALGITQDSGMQGEVADFRQVARSMRLGPVLTFAYWRMNWHCEHHMYAAVPCYNLRALARHIAYDLPEPLSLVETWKEMIDIARKRKDDPTFVFEKALPPTASRPG